MLDFNFILKQLNDNKISKTDLKVIMKIYNINFKINKNMSIKDIIQKIKNSFIHIDNYSAGIRGRRKYMEDKYSTFKSETFFISCIFDGHGGDKCSNYFNDNFILNFLKTKTEDSNTKNNLLHVIKKLNTNFLEKKEMSGSTINIFYIDFIDKNIYNINLGDSRSIVGYDNKVKSISRDHKPELKSEQKYIIKNGGHVSNGRVQGVLAMSRAVGDKDIQKYINDTPNFFTLKLNKDIKFLLHATDGLFDVLTNKDIYKIIMKNLSKNLSAKEITEKLLKIAYDSNSQDNISISLILF